MVLTTLLWLSVALLIAFDVDKVGSFASSSESCKFEEYEIIPDVIDKCPDIAATVIYNNNVEVNMGNDISPNDTTEKPTTVSWGGEEGSLYTLYFCDPDIPSRDAPLLREFRHWFVLNIHGEDIQSGDTISTYINPAPPKGTGFHRYLFLIYKQPCKINIAKPSIQLLYSNKATEVASRARFSIKQFAKDNCLLGPIAGNFFKSEGAGLDATKVALKETLL